MNFQEIVQKHWTPDRIKKLTSGHKYTLLPNTSPELLRSLGILNSDGSMSADSARKFKQINHLFGQFKSHFEELNSRHKTVRILDAGCGSSYLTFLVGWAYKNLWKHPFKLIGIDSNSPLIEKSIKNSRVLGFDDSMDFKVSAIESFDWAKEMDSLENTAPKDDTKNMRPHAVIALHACDTATDDAIALGINLKADFVAVAPCCQAELARQWKGFAESGTQNSFRPAFANPLLRREIAANVTDLMRVLLLRANGYEVTTTEFTMSHATPKNTLITAVRRGNYHSPSQAEYTALVESLGGGKISLDSKIAK